MHSVRKGLKNKLPHDLTSLYLLKFIDDHPFKENSRFFTIKEFSHSSQIFNSEKLKMNRRV